MQIFAWGGEAGSTLLISALFKGQLYFLVITISSFHGVRNLCCVACGSCFYFQALLALGHFLLSALKSSLCPYWMLCVRCVFCKGDAYVTIQLLTNSVVLIKLSVFIFKEALKI